MDAELARISKFLSLVLRHRPEVIGLRLDERGWVDVDELLRCASEHGRPLSRDTLDAVVATNDEQRFAFSDDRTRIRASQGHSLAVDLALEAREPPEVLFHGTATRFLAAILAQGLTARSRQHVHLSRDVETATQVGARHGQPVVLRVAAGAMFRAGALFFLSANGVWLTNRVAPEHLALERGRH